MKKVAHILKEIEGSFDWKKFLDDYEEVGFPIKTMYCSFDEEGVTRNIFVSNFDQAEKLKTILEHINN